VLSGLGHRVFGSGVLQKLLLFSVLTSASASTQTTILPTARTTISMASWGALPKAFARVHPRFLTPSFSTLAMGAVSVIWTVGLLVFDTTGNVLGDSITGLGFSICFYYGFTGIACAFYYRREIFKSVHRALLVGLVPLLGGAGMFFIFIKSYITSSKAGANYSAPFLGVQVPIVIGVGGLLLGVVFMAAQWIFMPDFFKRKLQTADPAILEDHLSHAGP
jgi:amino acid transporter